MSKPIKHLSNRFYEFGPFSVDMQNSLLLRAGEVVSLKPKVFDTLLALLERPGAVLSKDELMNQVWVDSFVEESNLTHNISVLRKVLGDEADGESYIETIPKRGYRFVAEVREVVTKEVPPVVEIRPPMPLTLVEERPDAPLPVQPPKPHQWQPLRGILLFGVILLAVAAALVYVWLKNKPTQPVSHAPIKSVAVLPFKPLDAERRDEKLELGMAADLITKLSNLRELKVSRIGSVRKYTALNQDPLDAGRELQVDAVLDASYQQDGEKMRAHWSLLRVSDGSTILADKCDQSCSTLFVLQDAVAQQIVSKLALQLTSGEKEQLAKHYTENTEAYRLYQAGQYYFRKNTKEGFEKSIKAHEQAIRIDPNYALAYAGLALTYSWVRVKGMIPENGARQKGMAAVEHALQLDGHLAEAHYALAEMKFYDWDWTSAIQEYQRALELNPGSADIHEQYARTLDAIGRTDEALVERQRALELDPTSARNRGRMALLLAAPGKYDEAIEELLKAIAMQPDYPQFYFWLEDLYLKAGRYEEAITAIQKARELDNDPSGRTRLPELAYAYALAGRKDEAKRILAELKEVAKKNPISPMSFATIYHGLGDKEQTFAYLEKAYAEHYPLLCSIRIWDKADPFRADPRYADLMRRMNLAP